MNLNPLEFQKTISKELDIVQNRVRFLIGDSHWGEDGRYKEAVLKNIIGRFLPTNLSIGTGFIINTENGEMNRTKQIDLIIYDNTTPLYFREGDFIIISSEGVLGIIEVKTRVNNNDIAQIFNTMYSNGLIAKPKFNGLFSFNEGNIRITQNTINENLKESLIMNNGEVNHICFGSDIFVKYWNEGNPTRNLGEPTYSFYKIENLAFSYFISNMINLVSNHNINDVWFRFPINTPNGKENFNIYNLSF